MRRVGTTLLAAAALMAGACGGGGSGSSGEDVAAGSGLYAQHCATCHGAEGVGGTGPVLKEKRFLAEATEERLVNQIAVGIRERRCRRGQKTTAGR